MTVGFNGTNFRIMSDDAYLPAPVPDDRGYLTYTARIGLDSIEDWTAMLGYLSTITDIPAMGIVGGGMVVIEAGTGSAELTIPLPGGLDEQTYDAVLTGFEGRYMLTAETFIEADATWRLLGIA